MLPGAAGHWGSAGHEHPSDDGEVGQELEESFKAQEVWFYLFP